jgi:hypothetical protein
VSDELRPDLRALVEAERERPDAPSTAKEAARSKLAALLGPSAGLGDVPKGTPATAGPIATGVSPWMAPAGKLAVAFVLGGVVGGSTVALLRPKPFYPSVSTSSPAVLPQAATANATVSANATPTVTVNATATVTATTTAPVPSPRARDTDLSAERALIDRSHAALARANAQAALEAVAQHEKSFPHGQLAEEREALAVQALVMAGRTQEAANRAGRFRKAYPQSVFLPVVDEALR